MQSCGQCGNALPAGASSCRYCGTAVSASPALDLSADGLSSLPALDKIVVPPRDRASAQSTASSTLPRIGSVPPPASRRPAPLPGPPRSATGSTLSGARAPGSGSTLGGGRPPGSGSTLGGARTPATLPGDPLGPGARNEQSATGKRRIQKQQTADGLPDAVADPSAFYGRGMVLDDDPLNSTFGSGAQAPALELDDARSDQPEEEVELGAAPTPETPEQTRRRQLEEIAQYGPRPKNLLGAPAYWIKVMLRKRALDVELITVAAQRKRTEDGAIEAQVALGEALFALRDDERLAKVRKLLTAIGEAEGRLGHVDAEGQKRKQSTNSELARLDREIARLEQQAAPLREREAALAGQVAEIEARLQQAEMLRRKAETELEALARKGAAADPELRNALRAERDVRHGDVQTIGVEMRPVQDDLGLVRKDLGKILRQISVVQSEKQTNITVLDRAQSHERVSRGHAQSARQQALVALAQAANKHKLLGLVPEQAAAANDARARADEKRAYEELHRAAAASYDHEAYQRGMMILLGGSGLFLFSLIVAILF